MDTVNRRCEDIEDECPSEEFNEGAPSGTCWGDGHYLCETCKLFRSDFVGAEGVEKRSWLLMMQGHPMYAVKIGTLK